VLIWCFWLKILHHDIFALGNKNSTYPVSIFCSWEWKFVTAKVPVTGDTQKWYCTKISDSFIPMSRRGKSEWWANYQWSHDHLYLNDEPGLGIWCLDHVRSDSDTCPKVVTNRRTGQFSPHDELVHSAVLRLHVIHPSVRLWRWWIRITLVGNLGN